MYGFTNHEELRKYQGDRRKLYEEANLSPEDNKKLLLHLLYELDRLENAVLLQEKTFKEVMGMNSANQYIQNTVDSSFYDQSK